MSPLPKRRASELPEGWDPARIKRVIAHYESQSEEEALAEDEAARSGELGTYVLIPRSKLAEVRRILGTSSSSRKETTASKGSKKQ